MLKSLTADDIEYVVEKKGVDFFLKEFRKSPEEFGQVKPGFRSDKMNKADIVELMMKKSDIPFMEKVFNLAISSWNEAARFIINKNEEKGYSHQKALIEMITDSFWTERPLLCMKLLNNNYDDEFMNLVKDGVEIINDIKKKMKREIKESIDGEYTLILKDIKNKENKIDDLLGINKSLNERILDNEKKINEYEQRIRWKDDRILDKKNDKYPYTSLGRVCISTNGNLYLERLADVDEKGNINIFYVDEHERKVFGNRNSIRIDDDADENEYGIWRWNAVPHNSNIGGDYVISEYSYDLQFIEVVYLPKHYRKDDVIKELYAWDQTICSSSRMLLVYKNEYGKLKGILCGIDDFEGNNECRRLKNMIFRLPEYDISSFHILEFEGIRIYDRINMGVPNGFFYVKKPNEALKELFLSRMTISSLREKSLSKKEANACREFIRKIPIQDLMADFEDSYGCDSYDADEYIGDFCEHILLYLNKDDFDMDVLVSALNKNPALVNMCEKRIAEQWKDENDNLIHAAQLKLEKITQGANEKKNEYDNLLTVIEEEKQKIKDLHCEIKKQEKLAKDVENKVSKRIENAKNNVADFISEMAFINPLIKEKDARDKNDKISCVDKSFIDCCWYGDYKLECEKDFREELISNLMINGYGVDDNDYSISSKMAAVISFSICNNIPVLIDGNERGIASCVASTMGSDKYINIYMENRDLPLLKVYEFITNACRDEFTVFLIHGAFDSYGVSSFIKISNRMKEWGGKVCCLFSLEGCNINMLPVSLMQHTFYIDGNIGLERIQNKSLRRWKTDFDFINFDVDENYLEIRNDLKDDYGEILDNMQLNLCSSFKTAFIHEDVDFMINLQVIVIAIIRNKMEWLRDECQGDRKMLRLCDMIENKI